jgi:hypothetical protein
MIIVFFLLFYLLLMVFGYTNYKIKGVLLAFLLIIVIHLLLIERRMNHVNNKKYPHFDYHTIYNNLKHGDIVFTCGYNNMGSFDKLLVFANKGVTHGGIITEEDGVKYIIHAFPGNWDRPFQDESNFIKGMSIPFRLYKEPAIVPMIRDNNTLFYQVFRHPDFVLNIPKTPSLVKNRWLSFCTAGIANTLLENKVIIKESEKIISYQPDSMINQLISFGYESFYMVHDRNLD